MPATRREIIFDTETTGLDIRVDRVIEIGCVELINHIQSGKIFQIYINPERSISIESYRVHGLSEAFLAEKPVFADAIDGFVAFAGDDPLIAHNAEFDLAFLNAQLKRIGRPGLDPGRVVDSLALARQRHPAGPNSLDALCARYGIDNSNRSFHGALIDASLLAEVYIELIGGRQASLGLSEVEHQRLGAAVARFSGKPRPVPLSSRVSDEDRVAHSAFVASLKHGGIWADYGAGR